MKRFVPIVLVLFMMAGCAGFGVKVTTPEQKQQFVDNSNSILDAADFTAQNAYIDFEALCTAKMIGPSECAAAKAAKAAWDSVYASAKDSVLKYQTGEATDQQLILKAITDANRALVLTLLSFNAPTTTELKAAKRELKKRAAPPQCPPSK